MALEIVLFVLYKSYYLLASVSLEEKSNLLNLIHLLIIIIRAIIMS